VVDGDDHLPRLDDRLQRVGELRDHLHLERGLAVVGTEAGRGVWHVGAGRAPDHGAAKALEALLAAREMVDRVGLAVADHHVGLARDDRSDQLGNVGAEVLVVGVGVDDHVGAELQAGIEAGLEGRGEPLVVGEADDVIDAVSPRHLDGVIGRAVVDHEPLDLFHARDLTGEVSERGRKLGGLVEAGNLNDELHRAAG
jgi:hypothetical protein